MEIELCSPRVIHGLFLNFNFCLEIFFGNLFFNFVHGGLDIVRYADIKMVRYCGFKVWSNQI